VQRLLTAVCLLAFGADLHAAAPDEQFEKVIRPLLVAKCFGCHGEQKQKGDLRLDSLAAMLRGGESGPAVVPGKPEQSLIVTAVRHNEQLKMPPKEKLSAADIAALVAWVKAGAVWPDAKPVVPGPAKPAAVRTFTNEEKAFWAFQPVQKGEFTGQKPGAKNPIDHFIRARLEKAGLKPAPEADKRTLIRRVTFDLTGLPPTPAEVEAFAADTSPDAWDKVIDRLLASPAYGE
jgi:mono/diheme cytochrome c family protein